MKPSPVIIGICLVLCVATMAGVAVQGRRLDALRAEEQQLQLEIQKLNSNPARPGAEPAAADHVGTRPTTSPSSELLRLRNQVSLLSRRQRELAGVPEENERLRARLAGASTNAATVLPPGYIRKSEAQFVGYTSPENTLQSLLWGLQNRDFASLVAATYIPENTRERQKDMVRTGKTSEEFIKVIEVLPGFRVVSRNVKTNDLIELQVEIVPGQDSQTVLFRQINGQWKIDSH